MEDDVSKTTTGATAMTVKPVRTPQGDYAILATVFGQDMIITLPSEARRDEKLAQMQADIEKGLIL